MWVWMVVGCAGPLPGRVADPGVDAVPEPPVGVPAPDRHVTGDLHADADGDGFDLVVDCDDQRADVHPGAPELCDGGLDNDCDLATPDAGATTDGQTHPTLAAALAATTSGVVGLCPGIYAAPAPIQRPVILHGAGVGLTVIAAGDDGPAIEVRAGGVLFLTGVTLTGGRNVELGGGIAVNAGAIARIEDVEIVANQAASGGGLYVGGTVDLIRTTVGENLATGDDAPGGGILVGRTATLRMWDVDVRDNAGKAGMWVDGGFVEIVGGSFDGNDLGLFVGSGGELGATACAFLGNDVYGLELAVDAGPVDVGDASFSDNAHDVHLPDGTVLDDLGATVDVMCADGVCDWG